MALKINGTTGISGVDGSASAPAVTGTDSNTGINFGSDFLAFNTGGTERARFADSGNFGINRTTPSYPLVARRTDASGIVAEFANSSGYGLMIGQNSASGEAYLRTGTGQALAFVTNGGSGLANERMRIKNDGNTVIDSAGRSFAHLGQFTSTHDGSRFGMALHNTNGGGSNQISIRFHRNDTDIGSISTTATATHFNTSSDYRLKENAVAISDGITRLKTLKPYRFNWKSDSSTTVDGFFAHEVSSIVPEAITGTKDAVATEDDLLKNIKKDDPIYQSIDQSKLVPLLTSALQEAIGRIEVLETKVATLEVK